MCLYTYYITTAAVSCFELFVFRLSAKFIDCTIPYVYVNRVYVIFQMLKIRERKGEGSNTLLYKTLTNDVHCLFLAYALQLLSSMFIFGRRRRIVCRRG